MKAGMERSGKPYMTEPMLKLKVPIREIMAYTSWFD
jgi:hypothetical protein